MASVGSWEVARAKRSVCPPGRLRSAMISDTGSAWSAGMAPLYHRAPGRGWQGKAPARLSRAASDENAMGGRISRGRLTTELKVPGSQ
jgi:hypothetical protein